MEKKRLDLINDGSRYLRGEGIVNHLGEAEVFLSHILNCSRVRLYLDNLTIEENTSSRFWDLLKVRSTRYPLQYLLKETEFAGLNLKTKEGVFIPRPETEILIDKILQIVGPNLRSKSSILDIGTGSGNIAISLAKALEEIDVFACDISDSALQLAKENANRNKAQITFIKSDLFSAFNKKEVFSLIVSNPPYIKKGDIATLAEELSYEPKKALDGGDDGLFYYRKIIAKAPNYLSAKGFLAFEIGADQADSVKTILIEKGKFSLIAILKDYNNMDRVVIAQKKK